MSALETAGWIVLASATTWGCTLAKARAALTRVHMQTRTEIRYWQDQAMRARASARQARQDAETSAAARKESREELASIVTLIAAAYQRANHPTPIAPDPERVPNSPD